MKSSIVLGEIVQGYSDLEIEGTTFFFKHPSVADRFNLYKLEKTIEKRGRSVGLLSKEEILNSAIEKGKWTDDDEKAIKSLEWVIDSRKTAKDKLSDPSEKTNLQNMIERDELELKSYHEKRIKICSASLEDYVTSKLPVLLCRQEIFEDEYFKRGIDSETAKKAIVPYIEKWNQLADRNTLLRAIYSPNFFDLLFIYDNLDNIFSKNIYKLSFFQKELLGYAKILHSKLTKMPNIPEGVKKDPLKLYLFEEKMSEKEVEVNLRKSIESKGGLENMKPEDKVT